MSISPAYADADANASAYARARAFASDFLVANAHAHAIAGASAYAPASALANASATDFLLIFPDANAHAHDRASAVADAAAGAFANATDFLIIAFAPANDRAFACATAHAVANANATDFLIHLRRRLRHAYADAVAAACAYAAALANAIAGANANATASDFLLISNACATPTPSPPPAPPPTPSPTPSPSPTSFLTQREEPTMLTYEIAVHFDRGYIADPYWPEVAKLIDVQKKSGLNRARSEANRRKALEGFLSNAGMTMADYEALERKAKEPFYHDEQGQIIIPELHVASFLVATCDESRSAGRPCEPNQVRSRFIVSPWSTGKTEPDGLWERFAVVSAGTGQTLSNQRGLRQSYFIKNFDARGTLSFEPDYVEPKTLEKALVFGGRFVGIGASRKMGWGRFELTDFALIEAKAAA